MPLTVAASVGNVTIARELVLRGAEIFRESFETKSTIELASLYNKSVVDIFIDSSSESDAYFNHAICLSPTPLYMACYAGHRLIVELLLSYGAAANFPSPEDTIWMQQGKTPSYSIRYALDSRLRVPKAPRPNWSSSKPDIRWELPTQAAIDMGHEAIVDILFSSGALTQEEFDCIFGPYFSSLYSQQAKTEKLLVDSMITGTLPKNGNKELHKLCWKPVINSGSRVLSIMELWIPAVASAKLEMEHRDCQISQLIDQIRISEPDCQDPLHVALLKAVACDAKDRVQSLLLAGASVSAPDDDGIPVPNPLLVSSARDGNDHLQGAIIDVAVAAVRTSVGTPGGLCNQKKKIRRRLSLQRIINATIMNSGQDSLRVLDYCKLLELASLESIDKTFNENFVTDLYRILAFPSGDSNPLETALFAALLYRKNDTVSLLLVIGANINARDKNGMTPLICATEQGTTNALIRRLLSLGADPNVFDHAGETASYKAAVNDNLNVIDILKVCGNPLSIQNLRATVHLCVSNGKAKAWSAITCCVDLCEDVYLSNNEMMSSYNTLRGHYFLNRPCHSVEGLFELPGP